MSAHESFEQLCALATTGDIDPEDFRLLQTHLLECASCRASYSDFHAIVERGFPALEPRRRRWSFRGYGLKRRFNARARKEGISVSGLKRVALGARRFAPAALTALVFLAMAGEIWRTHWRSEEPLSSTLSAPSESSEIAALTQKVAELERQLASRAGLTEQVEAIPESGRELSRLQSEYNSALAARALLEERVETLSMELGELRGRSEISQNEMDRLQRNLREAENALFGTNQSLESLRAARSEDTATIAEQRRRLGQLDATVREQAEIIQRDRELLSADKDIRDLIAARDLKIVDVWDDGTPGRTRPIPGRIFYTRGKSLVFYAYDLQNKGNVDRVSFQVWGKKDGRSQAPRSLGILYADDSAQKRWALKFEDPEVLSEIDQVFVTMEPPGGSRQPTGKQLLTAAFLNEAANHP
jgi:hypothetical protein